MNFIVILFNILIDFFGKVIIKSINFISIKLDYFMHQNLNINLKSKHVFIKIQYIFIIKVEFLKYFSAFIIYFSYIESIFSSWMYIGFKFVSVRKRRILLFDIDTKTKHLFNYFYFVYGASFFNLCKPIWIIVHLFCIRIVVDQILNISM